MVARQLALAAALLGATAHGQVSESVVRELIALNGPQYEWRYLAMSLESQGETDLAMVVIDAHATHLKGRLYEWHRRNRNVKGMLHELDAQSGTPMPLPRVIEDAIILGGIERAKSALDHVRRFGLSVPRNYQFGLDRDDKSSPEFLTCFMLANEGRMEEAIALLPLVSAEELAAHRESILNLTFRNDPRFAQEIARMHPGFFSPTVLLELARVGDDENLRESAIKRFLYDVPAPQLSSQSFQILIVDLCREGRTNTARRIARRTWHGLIAGQKSESHVALQREAIAYLSLLGLGREIRQYAEALVEEARVRLSNGEGLVSDEPLSPHMAYAEAVTIYVAVFNDGKAEELLSEFDVLYKSRKNSMSLAGDGLRHVKVGTLLDMGKYGEAIDYASRHDVTMLHRPLPLFAVNALLARGRLYEARAISSWFLEDLLPAFPQAFGNGGYWIIGDLAEPMCRLGMQKELRQWVGSLDSSGAQSLGLAKAYAALGEVEQATAHADAAMKQRHVRTCLSATEISLWQRVTKRTLRELAPLVSSINDSVLDSLIVDSKFEGKYVRGFVEELVATFKYVQGDDAMTKVVLRCLERVLSSISAEQRESAEYAALNSAVRGGSTLTDDVVLEPLKESLQRKILEIVIKLRNRTD